MISSFEVEVILFRSTLGRDEFWRVLSLLRAWFVLLVVSMEKAKSPKFRVSSALARSSLNIDSKNSTLTGSEVSIMVSAAFSSSAGCWFSVWCWSWSLEDGSEGRVIARPAEFEESCGMPWPVPMTLSSSILWIKSPFSSRKGSCPSPGTWPCAASSNAEALACWANSSASLARAPGDGIPLARSLARSLSARFFRMLRRSRSITALAWSCRICQLK